VTRLVASAYVPGAEQLLDRLAVAAVVLVVVGWLTWHAVGELRLSRELRRPPKEPRAGWATCMVRVDPVTGAPWREPADQVGGESR
jgi:hypothetical protein